MNKNLIKSIVRCAFRICFIYFLKCFLPLIIIDSRGSSSSLLSMSNYEIELLKQISILKKLVLQFDSDESLDSSASPSVNESPSASASASENTSTNASANSNNSNDSHSENSESLDSNTKHLAYEKIKENITNQLKEKYGAETRVEFNICNDKETDKNNVKNDMICALKIKEMGKTDPDPEKYGNSDIYVNTKTKTFHVKTLNGFQSFPLGKKSIVKCEKSDE